MRRGRRIDVLKDAGHITSGFMTALVAAVEPVLAVIMALVFIIYQLDEDWHIEDESFRDIAEFGAGLYVGASLLVLARLFGVA